MYMGDGDMINFKADLAKWGEDIANHHLPRWEELPDLELYMDQVITYIENKVSIFSDSKDKKLLTPSMVNNYVKLKLIPKPIKKKYNRVHLAYLIAISILKQVLTIQEIKDGIMYQVKVCGEKEAYNLFCYEQEEAIRSMVKQISSKDKKVDLTSIDLDNIIVKTATLAFASKIIAEKAIELQKNALEDFNNE